ARLPVTLSVVAKRHVDRHAQTKKRHADITKHLPAPSFVASGCKSVTWGVMAMSQNGDGLDFDQKTRLRQALHDNKCAGRIGRLGKDLIARLAHLWTIRPMCDERGGFHKVARR